MNHKSLFLAACLGVSTLIAAAQPTLSARECTCYTGEQTNIHWGLGSSCTAATSNLRANTLVEAAAWCNPDPVCSLVVVTTTSCWPTGLGTYQVNGYATFGCKVCEPIVP